MCQKGRLVREKGVSDPSPSQIRRRMEAIKHGWSPEERVDRGEVEPTWLTPLIPYPDPPEPLTED